MRNGNKVSDFSLIWKLIIFVKDIEPKIFLSFLGVTISSAIYTVLLVYLPKIIIDGVMGNWAFMELSRELLKYSVLILFFRLVSNISEHKFIQDRSSFSYKMNAEFSKKVLSLKYELLEDTNILDLSERAKYPLHQYLLFSIFDNLRNLGIAGAKLIGVGTILATFNIWITIFAVLMCLVTGFFLEKGNKITEEFARDLMPINRRYNYFLGILSNEEFQKEYRLFQLNLLIEQKLKKYMDITLDRFQNVYTESAKIETINQIFISLTRFVIYLYSALRVLGIGGEMISLGNFSIIVTASEEFSNSINSFITAAISINRDIRFTKPLFEFYELEEYGIARVENKIATPLETLEFKNVSFSYPNSDKEILKNISFKLHKGETLALVGKNNAGKSTLVKLIARLFQPTEGEILWNGDNIENLDLKSYLKELAYVFQDFQLFPFKIWENVSSYGKSDLEKAPKDIELKVTDCINRVGMKEEINELPHGLETWMNKNLHEDATEFSGGQRQKLAMARAIYKDASFAILDEPTAALDPLAESEVYENFSDLVKDKTALFISHRMSASRFCDRILVLDNGTIIGNGSHEELTKNNTLYKSLYEAQAQYYEN